MSLSNVAAFVRQRLLNRARETGEDYQILLTRYASERLLFRLGRSGEGERFVLKGAYAFLTEAIKATFERRSIPLPATLPQGLTAAFAEDERKEQQWRVFQRNSHLEAEAPSLASGWAVDNRIGLPGVMEQNPTFSNCGNSRVVTFTLSKKGMGAIPLRSADGPIGGADSPLSRTVRFLTPPRVSPIYEVAACISQLRSAFSCLHLRRLTGKSAPPSTCGSPPVMGGRPKRTSAASFARSSKKKSTHPPASTPGSRVGTQGPPRARRLR